MNRFFKCIVSIALTLIMSASSFAGQSAEIKLKDGSKWRGQVSDSIEVRFMQSGVEVPMTGRILKIDNLYIQIETEIAGKTTAKTIFKNDIVTMKTTSVGDGSALPAAKPASGSGSSAEQASPTEGIETGTNGKPAGVFLLPLRGGVGQTFRREEIELIGKEADKHGDGQIIVLLIDSNGGSSFESQKIAETIFDIRKRHRVIAWIHKAISAGCQTAMCCSEIYFMTEGTAGSVTTWNPGSGQSIKGQELIDAMEDLARIAERAQHNGGRFIAYAMKTNPALLSYDKDAEGNVTWYNDLSGEFDLSNEDENLCFNAMNAEHSKFSDGTADTEEELANLLNMPKWHEINDYGRKIAKNWEETYEEAERDIPLIMQRMGYKNTSTGDPVVIMGTQISLLSDLLHWWDRLGPNSGQSMLPPKDRLEREIAELRKAVADIRQAQRGR